MKKVITCILFVGILALPMQALAYNAVADKIVGKIVSKNLSEALDEEILGYGFSPAISGLISEGKCVTIHYASGNVYVGEVDSSGIPHGYGVYYVPIENAMASNAKMPVYEGDFVHGHLTGYGMLSEWSYAMGGLTSEDTIGLIKNGKCIFRAHNGRLDTESYLYKLGYEEYEKYGLAAMVIDLPYILSTNIDIAKLDVAPMIVDGSTYVPVRYLMDALGSDYDWNAETRQVNVYSNAKHIILTVDSTSAMVNGEEKKLPAPVIIENGRTLLPLRFVSEELGYIVEYEADTQAIGIYNNPTVTNHIDDIWVDAYEDFDGFIKIDGEVHFSSVTISENYTDMTLEADNTLAFESREEVCEYVVSLLHENGYSDVTVEDVICYTPLSFNHRVETPSGVISYESIEAIYVPSYVDSTGQYSATGDIIITLKTGSKMYDVAVPVTTNRTYDDREQFEDMILTTLYDAGYRGANRFNIRL